MNIKKLCAILLAVCLLFNILTVDHTMASYAKEQAGVQPSSDKGLPANAETEGSALSKPLETGVTPGGESAKAAAEPGVESAKQAGEPGGESALEAGEPSGESAKQAAEPGGESALEAGEPGVESALEAAEPGGESALEAGEPGGESVKEAGEPGGESVKEAGEPGGESAKEATEPGEELEEESAEPAEESAEAATASAPAFSPTVANSISGFFWMDGNGDLPTDWDGLYNGDEQPLAGYNVYLYAADDLKNSLAKTQTDANGNYIFTELEAGSYVLGLKGESVAGIDYLAPIFLTSDNKFAINWSISGLPAYTEAIELAQGQAVKDINAGLRLPMGIARLASPSLSAIWSTSLGSKVTLDGYDWLVIRKKTVNGLNCVLLLRMGSRDIVKPFGPSTNYEGSNLQSWMTNFYEKNVPFIKTIAVVPTLGDHYSWSAVSEPTAVPAASVKQTKDIIFAPSRGDLYDGKSLSFYPPQVAAALKESYGNACRQWMRTFAQGAAINGWFTSKQVTYMDEGINHKSDGAYGAPAVWISTTSFVYKVTVNYLDKASGKQIRQPDTQEVYIGETFKVDPIPIIEGYRYINEWKEGTTGAPIKTSPVTLTNITADKNIYLYYEPSATDVIVAKTVTGDFGEQTRYFEFTICLKTSDDKPLTVKFIDYKILDEKDMPYSSGVLITDWQGKDTFRLAHGQKITIMGIPADARIQVLENKDSNYKISYTDSKYQGVLNDKDMEFDTVGNKPRTFEFINDRIAPPFTGVDAGLKLREALLFLVALVILAGFIASQQLRRRAQAR